eukprot:7796641-Alexandrium_andersonii.AAC.1
METQDETQLLARILTWRTAVQEPHACTHAFASARWPKDDAPTCVDCGQTFGLRGRWNPMSAVYHPCVQTDCGLGYAQKKAI